MDNMKKLLAAGCQPGWAHPAHRAGEDKFSQDVDPLTIFIIVDATSRTDKAKQYSNTRALVITRL